MKRGTESIVRLGKSVEPADFSGINVLSTVILGKKESATKDFNGLFITDAVMLGKKISHAAVVTATVHGVSPLSLPSAVANSLSYVKAFGGTEQRNLPNEYTELEYIEFTGTQYIDTGITPLNSGATINMKITPSTIANLQFLYGQNPTEGIQQVGCFLNTNGKISWQYSSALRLITDVVAVGTTYDITLGNGSVTINGTTKTGTPDTPFTTNMTVLVGAAWGPSYTSVDVRRFVGKVYAFSYKLGGQTLVNLVPAKNSSNVVGMYDTVSGQFFTNAGTGTFAAGGEAVPTPDAPMDIVSNNGVLKARHQSGLPLGYDLLDKIVFNGTQELDTDFICNQDTKIVSKFNGSTNNSWVYGTGTGNPRITCYLSTTGNERFGNVTVDSVGLVKDTIYILTQDKNGFYFNSGQGKAYTNVGTFTTVTSLTIGNSKGSTGTPLFSGDFYYMQIFDNNVLARNYLPVKRRSDNAVGLYDLVNGGFLTDTGLTAGNTVSDPVEIYTDGTVETIKDSLNNIATAEMLLKVGNYQDVQSIIDGVVTRNVGVLVLDGTENWTTRSGSDTCYAYFDYSGINANTETELYCTHFGVSARNISEESKMCVRLNRNGFLFCNDLLCANNTTWTQYLADQYAAGTPVMIIYPLATPTTESVAGQTLQVQAGDNTLEITQASLTGLELEAQYQKRE